MPPLEKDLTSDGFGDTAILNPRVVKGERDLSRRIEQGVPKHHLDRVKCVHVFDDFYRCNWWAQPEDNIAGRHPPLWSIVATQRVRKSQFLRVTMAGEELVIKEIIPRNL